MKTKAPLILGSQSPRRQQLLREAGFEFEVVVRPVNEYFPEDLHPRAVAVMISENKAKPFDDLSQKHIVITADTIVALEDQLMGKPADAKEATEMLSQLSGRTHAVYTGVTLFYKGRFRSFAEETMVTFRRLKPEEIKYYVDTFKPFDKAGAYGIQEWIGMTGVSRIEGDYYNVVGLPLARLFQELDLVE
ncbi:MAG: septum formation protein Maf [Bacteroidetes bacterium]|nr:MAG: septum formation protein Maf [Bacteroidota bacterium]